MEGLLLFPYFVVGLVLSWVGMGRMLRGNHNAPKMVHAGIGAMGLLIVFLWPIALVAYANFLVAKAAHRLYLKLVG